MAHYEKTEKKGHGCCGGIFTLLIVCVIIVGLLIFTTDTLGSVKQRAYEYFYPLRYSEYVSEYAGEFSVDETLVYAVIRTESGFRAEVTSSAGAMGLMQIMPDTFSWLQENLDGQVIYSDSDLLTPQINIRYGTYYLSMLLSHYDGRENLAVAAYNAGMTNVDNWLEDNNYSVDGITLDDVPYVETKQYIERVENTKAVYESLYYDNN